MSRALLVWWDGAVIGRLSVDQHGDTQFAYACEWLSREDAKPISVSLPLRAEPYGRRESRPFFEGMLPEERQRSAVAQALGVSEDNEFKLLEQLGGDVAGALSLWPEGEQPPAPSPASGDVVGLGEDALAEIIAELPIRPMLAGTRDLRVSLAGAQSKLPVVLATDGEVALPVPGQPTTYLLKPPIERFAGTTENEAFAMRLAAAIGLGVAPVQVRRAAGKPFLLVRRYDRTIGEDGTVRRLHQEDFCQALGYPSSRKYAADGGPVMRDCFELLRRAATRPAREVLKLFDAAIFNVAIGNADAHAKNFSLLHTQRGIELAPLYDLLSTVAYEELSPRLSMKLARRSTLEELRSDDWGRFATEVGLTLPYVRRRAGEIVDLIIGKAQSVAESLRGEQVDGMVVDYAHLATGRAKRLQQTLG